MAPYGIYTAINIVMHKDHELGRSSDLGKMEEEFIKRVSPEIERRVAARIIENLVESLEWQTYPTEDRIKPELVEKVRKAERGKGKVFRDVKEFKKYLASL